MSVLNDKVSSIIDKLAKKTMTEGLDWREGDSSSNFIINFPRSSVELNYSEQQDQYEIFIYNEQGMIVERRIFPADSGSYKIFQEVYDHAKRQALKIDTAVDDILESLG